MIISEQKKIKAEEQILLEKVPVDYDTREFTVEHIIEMYEKGEYKIPPYQREFVWKEDKQSKFIESVILDLPIPYLFFADDKRIALSKKCLYSSTNKSSRIRTGATYVTELVEEPSTILHISARSAYSGRHLRQ